MLNRTNVPNPIPHLPRHFEPVVSQANLVLSSNKGLFQPTAWLLAALLLFLVPRCALAQTSAYVQTNIVSDGWVPAMETDTTLVNPWGISIGPQFWIDSPSSGYSLVESATGQKSFAVSVSPAKSTASHGTPAGTVYNTDASIFPMSGGYAQFLFGTLDGTIAGWNSNTPEAVTIIDNSAKSASYTDIAVGKNANGSYLFAANFAAGTVDVFDSSFAPAQLTGNFSDPAIPAGFSPFGIHTIGGKVFVTYAQLNAQGRENVGPGLGYVDVFDTEGNLLESAISQGYLNAPWGMALAPAGFGSLGGDLLVGNFGDGIINAFDPNTFAFKGQVQDASGNPITNTGLWEIVFGSNRVGDANTLYFAAGINAEKDGLFGSIAVVSPATGSAGFSLQSSVSAVTVTAAQPGSATISLTSANGFTGAVALTCSGLPTHAACSFSSSTVTLAASGTQSVVVSIAETSSPTSPNPYDSGRFTGSHTGRMLAFLGPVGLLVLAGFRRRSRAVRALLFLAVVSCFTWAVSGCSSSATPASPGPPVTVQVMINATSGAITQSIPITVTLQ